MFPLSALLIAGTAAVPMAAAVPDAAAGQMPEQAATQNAAAQTAPPVDDAKAALDAKAAGHELIPIPSGKTVWLQESRSDNLPGSGLVERFRFVMPSLADRVPPMDTTAPEGLSADDMAALNDGSLQGHEIAGDAPVIQISPADGSAHATLAPDFPSPILPSPGDAFPDGAVPPDDGMIPEEQFNTPVAPVTPGTEQAADEQVALPPAPDVIMQDPVHDDAVWLCQNIALPRIAKMNPRPAQVMISLGSAESAFGTFDPQIVQLFEAFSVPADRDECVWEPW